jgi:hypothetical protein
MLQHLLFPGELLVSQATTDNLLHADHEAVNLISLPVVKPEGLLVKIAKQVKRFHADVCASGRAFQERPEISMPVLFGMVNELARELVESLI